VPAYGFSTSLGFVSPTDADLLTTYIEYFFTETGILIDQTQASPDLDTAKTVARILKDAWDDAAGTYASGSVGGAEGAGLRNLLYPFIGPPLPDSFSTVVLPLTGVALTNVPAGSAVRLDSDGAGATTWVLSAPVVIPGDGTFVYQTAGAKTAAAASTWTIATPVAGWATAGPNVAAAVKGRLAETDLEYRQRFALSVQEQIIGAAVAAVPGVTTVRLFENPTDVPDSFWGQTHWLEVLVQGGDDTEIAEAIQAARTYTVNLLGTTTETIPDDFTPSGTKDILFSRPEDVDVWVELTITKGEGYSLDTSAAAIAAREDAIRTQILTWGETRAVGLNVSVGQIAAQVMLTPTVPGIFEITGFVDDNAVPITTSVVAEVRQLLVFDAARIDLIGV
jgi:hypothetical protein